MVTDEVSGYREGPGSNNYPTPQEQTLGASESVGPSRGSSDASATAPIGLGFGGLQPLTRVSECTFLLSDSQVIALF